MKIKPETKPKIDNRPPWPYANITTEERIRILANIFVDRILEEEKLYKERLKTDPKAKRVYEMNEEEKSEYRKSKNIDTNP